jgi:DNA-binding response OmpR family regulator
MGSPLKIAIVEDDTVIRNLTALRVVKLGHEVHSQFGTGESALAGLEKSVPDLVIMDIDLGDGIDGIETALGLQERQKIPVVFVSSFRDDATINRVKKVEGAEYIVKPFTDDGLRIAIGLALDKYRAHLAERASRDLQGMVLDQFFGGLVATDDQGVITFINHQARVLTKWTGPVDGLTHIREIVQIQHAASGTPLENMFDRILSERKIFWLPQGAVLVALDKSAVPVMGIASPLIGSGSRVTGMTVVLYPVSHPNYLEFRGRAGH